MHGERRRQAKELSARLRQRGATTGHIASVIMHQCGLNAHTSYRHALGLSQAQVAEEYNRRWPGPIPKTEKQISYWERWGGPGAATSASARAPCLEDLGRLAILYGCLIDDLLYGPRHRPGPPAVTVAYEVIVDVLMTLQPSGIADYSGQSENDAVVALRTPIGEGNITVTMSRRRFSALLAAGGLAALLPDAALAPVLAETNSITGAFRQTLLAHQAGHHLLTPAAHIDALTETLRSIAASREQARSDLRRELRVLQAEIAEHLSWLCREVADTNGCRRWSAKATTWALETGDTNMATYMMLRTATLALDHHDYPHAIELAQAAQHTSWQIPSTLLAVAHLYEARGRAGTGVIDSASLDTADRLLSAAPVPDGPLYLRFYNANFSELQRATCYLSAGQPSRAITILQAQLTALPATHHRDRAVHLARLGTAHAADQAPDAAAIAGLAGLAEAAQAGSKHAIAELKPLDTRLRSRWPQQPKVQEFTQALASAATP
ncbi:hypothetical protein ACFWY5_28045 [Nonomuraea sp. NPDC059007]|uniref:hypothetical protein n=1 Tax=Nonomuraea sp. NPDC059007 TaxID=3346692 RepID=UPI003689943F